MPTSAQDDPAIHIPKVTVLNLPETYRAKKLRALRSFVEGTQHDHMMARWDGSPRDPGVGYLWARMKPQGFVPTNAAPYGMRKPNVSYPLPRQVTMRFTELLLGEGRHPRIEVADPSSEAYLEAVTGEADVWDALIEARDYAGSTGSSALVLGVVEGQPVSEMLETAELYVEAWKQGSRWEPLEVVEQRLVEVDSIDPETRKIAKTKMWRTRMWDTEHVYLYRDVPENYGKKQVDKGLPPPPIPIQKDDDGVPMAFEHRAGRCPVVWIQNTRNNKSPEGRPDNEGALHLADEMDRLQSFIVRAAKANVDPTLVYLDDRIMHRQNPVLRKGWGSVIKGSEKATVSLLEITGASIEMAWKTMMHLRDEYLQTVGCVIVDPQNAGAFKSGEALSLLWRTMEAKANRLRVPIRDALKQLAEIWMQIGHSFDIVSTDAPDSQSDDDRDVMELPPKEVKKDGITVGWSTHSPGKARHAKVAWPPYHVPTATQLQQMAIALSTATGTKPTLSQETGVAAMLLFLGKGDPAEELERLKKQTDESMQGFTAAMFEGAGEDKTQAEDAENDADDQAEKGKRDD